MGAFLRSSAPCRGVPDLLSLLPEDSRNVLLRAPEGGPKESEAAPLPSGRATDTQRQLRDASHHGRPWRKEMAKAMFESHGEAGLK